MNQEAKSLALQKLSKLIHDVEEQGIGSSAGAVGTGWDDIDHALAGPGGDIISPDNSQTTGLKLSGIHEFYGVAERFGIRESELGFGEAGPSRATKPESRIPASPNNGYAVASPNPDFRPLCLLAHLARQGADQLAGQIAWVGSRSWPNPQFLERLGILDRSLFVEAADAGRRLWAIELSMRCPAVACVVGDAQGFKTSATRRLELVARDCNCLALLARPGSEAGIVSAALTRWAVHPLLQESLKPAWMLELLRCKGMQPAGGNHWPLEWDCAKGAVIISAAILERLSQAAPSQGRPRQTATG